MSDAPVGDAPIGEVPERELPERERLMRLPRGLTLRTLIPNAITAAALGFGLTGIRFAITGQFEQAVQAVIFAGVLDGIDGRVARMLKGQSRFGAELDSLADNVSFGVAPAFILFLWSLENLPRLGWFASLAYAICMALRLARFNAQIDGEDQPHKLAGFLTGVPAPAGAGLAMLPIYVWFVTGWEQLRDPLLVGGWLTAIAFLAISSVATPSWGSLRPRRSIRLELLVVLALVGAAALTEPWYTLIGICAVYLALVPYSMWSYARVKRRRAEQAISG